MDKELKEALARETCNQLNNLANLVPGSKEEQVVVDNIAKLYRLGLDEVRTESEVDDKFCKRESEAEDRETKEKNELRDNILKYGTEAAKLILPMLFYGRWMNKGLKFEETGTFTSTTFRGLFGTFSRILPTIK